ncbi:hypothetical protein DRH27_05780 [Candidatus Falkowbacteria bacterium]|nr:MAG: hypothetical protein DRH27_05780 [Candidatus Falkowbacteria bacterium]
MFVAIISDIHDNLINLKTCLDWCRNNKIEAMICCGDVTNSDTIEYLSKHFPGKIHLVKGNIELYNEAELEKYKNIIYYGKTGRFEIGSKIVGVCHEPFYREDVIKKGRCDIIFYGHTHKPWEKVETRHGASLRLVNPGTLGGVFLKATFAAWDTDSDNIELIILDNI